MVRYYHRTGALPEPPRTTNGYRNYRLGDVARLIHLTTLTRAGAPATATGNDLQDALVTVDAEIERLTRQRQVLTEMLVGPRRIPPDVTALLENTRQWFAGHELSDHVEQDHAALQLMVDSGMTTPETWELLRRTLPDSRRRALTVDGYRAWDELGSLKSSGPRVPALVERCRVSVRDGISAGLSGTLIPGTLPLTPEDLPVVGAQNYAVEALVAEMTP